MSILHLIVRRHMATRAPDRRTQRGCTVPPLLHEAAAEIVCITGGIARAGEPQDPAASDRGQATASAVGRRRARR